jgi:flagella basal body P-ring formation protein FlgA
MIRLIVYVLAALFLATAILNAAERPTLRADVTVTGGIVRVGDLVEHSGIVADAAIFRAPGLGETGTVPVSQVLEALRAHSLIGLDPGPITEVSVTRASRAIAPQEIETAVAEALGRDYELGNARDINITFDRAIRTLHVEPSVTTAPRVAQLRYDSRTGRFDVTIDIAGASSAGLRLSGTAIVTVEAVTLTRPLARGEVIKIDDLALQRVAKARASREIVTDPDQAIGLAARNALSVGRPLLAAELMKPEIVQRGAGVTIYYQAPGVMLAVRGKASEGGAEGDTIDVVNTQSNRTLRATVIAPGQVAVVSMAPRVLAATEITALEPPVSIQPSSGAK